MTNIPKWQSHKVVQADKIVNVSTNMGADGEARSDAWELACGVTIYALGSLRSRVPDGVSPLGGYYVMYSDGFESWSPSESFEGGYTRLA